VGTECAADIDYLRSCREGAFDIRLCECWTPREDYEVGSFEAIFRDGKHDRCFSGGSGENRGGDFFVKKPYIGGSERSVSECVSNFLTTQRSSACNDNASRSSG
jgi:hypothetical protein